MSASIPMCVGGSLRTRRFRVSFEYEENGICIAAPDHGRAAIYECLALMLAENDFCVDEKTLQVKEVED